MTAARPAVLVPTAVLLAWEVSDSSVVDGPLASQASEPLAVKLQDFLADSEVACLETRWVT